MKHSIRQHVINSQGLKTTKIIKVDGELGSGLCDCHGKEIFDGDKVEFYIAPDEKCTDTVSFCNGGCFIRDLPLYVIEALDIEIVGHVDD